MSRNISLATLPRPRVANILFLFAAPLLMLTLLEGFSRNDMVAVFKWLWQKPLMFLCNYAIFFGVCLLLSFIRGHRARAVVALALCLLCALLGIANHYKMLYRMEPLLFTDVTQLGDAAATLTGLPFEIDVRRIVSVLVLWAGATLLCLRVLRGKRERRAWLPPLAGLALLCWLPTQCTFALGGGALRTDMADYAWEEGTLYTAIAMENHRRSMMRINYEEAEVRAQYRELMRNDQAEAKSEEGERPNIIVVLAESFADEAFLSRFVNLTEELMPFYNSLLPRCQSGRLYVPKIGGGTSETEFEVLTGLRSQYAINPYSMGLPPMNSMAAVLRGKGYEATAIHWYSGVYYNRYANLKQMGFDSFYTTDTSFKNFEKQGMFVSDAEHYKAILKQLKTSESKDFIFCLTMQNHGGYEYDDFRVSYGANTPFSTQMSAESEKLIANYCHLLKQSDLALREFIAGLEALTEPTMVVFFGDHIPPLGKEVLSGLGGGLSGDEGHWTPYFIWSNKEALSGKIDMYAYELGAHALSLAGMNDDPFFRYVEELRQKGVREDARYDLLSYDALFGKQYAYDESGISPENKGFQIGGPMTLAGFDAAEIGDAIYLRPRLEVEDQAYRLCVGGVEQDAYFIQKTDEKILLKCVMPSFNNTMNNNSGTLVYENTNALLAASGELPYEAYPLWESDYTLERNKWYEGHYLFKSDRPLPAGRNTAVVADGERLNWQPPYGLRKSGQYAVDGDGFVYLTIPKSALGESEPTSDGLRVWLKQKDARLLAFEP